MYSLLVAIKVQYVDVYLHSETNHAGNRNKRPMGLDPLLVFTAYISSNKQ